ncbi:nitronate monooxygenase [soil metagenome]
MSIQTDFSKTFNLELPIIMAPMFLVSNEPMLQAAMRKGIMGSFPTLNYRKEGELDTVLNNLNTYRVTHNCKGNYGVNLIVQQTNPLYKKHLESCVKAKVPFYITSLGNPEEVIKQAHAYGAKVYCDVTNLVHAKKCASVGCDGFIAVGQGAGGHAGPYPHMILIPTLKKHFPEIPVIAAGGIATGDGLLSILALGASGASIGTLFIASPESKVSDEYKQAIIDSGMEDIVLTERLSGTPCAIINTPYAKKIGTKQGWWERLLSNNSTTKKYFKMLVQIKGMKNLEDAVKPGNYKNLWCAGQTVELIDKITPCEEIIARLQMETNSALKKLNNDFQS